MVADECRWKYNSPLIYNNMSTPLFDFTPLPIDENYKPIQGVFRNMASGNQTVVTAGVPVKLLASATECKSIDITANYSNADMITVGGSGVVGALSGRKGVPIAAGNTYTFKITDVSNVWIDSVSSGDGVSFNYFW
jgi:hypothetical protein